MTGAGQGGQKPGAERGARSGPQGDRSRWVPRFGAVTVGCNCRWGGRLGAQAERLGRGLCPRKGAGDVRTLHPDRLRPHAHPPPNPLFFDPVAMQLPSACTPSDMRRKGHSVYRTDRHCASPFESRCPEWRPRQPILRGLCKGPSMVLLPPPPPRKVPTQLWHSE